MYKCYMCKKYFRRFEYFNDIGTVDYYITPNDIELLEICDKCDEIIERKRNND